MSAAVSYTLPQAATGRDRSTILRAIKAGKLSATRDPAMHGWLIEPAELHRVYRVAPVHGAANGATRVADLEARLADALDQIGDLRRQRDRADDERRQVQARLDALLTDRRAPPRRWWRWRRAGAR
jgi:hypothetical protein